MVNRIGSVLQIDIHTTKPSQMLMLTLGNFFSPLDLFMGYGYGPCSLFQQLIQEQEHKYKFYPDIPNKTQIIF